MNILQAFFAWLLSLFGKKKKKSRNLELKIEVD
jgi:hypothetical protein